MARRAAAPRRIGVKRWAAFALVMFSLFVALIFQGYIRHEIGAAGTSDTQPAPAGLTAVPASVSRGGPVLDLSGDTPRSLRAAPHTVALTFDDGPDPHWTPLLLDLLQRRHVPATFFVVGSRALAHPDLVRREAASGNEVGIHTLTHTDLSALPSWRARLEVSLGQEALVGASGLTSGLLRPPYSSVPDALDARQYSTDKQLAREGYVVTLADRDSDDWARPGVGAIVARATPVGDSGAVILLHDGGGNRAQTIAAVDRLITDLQDRGYRFATLTDAVGLPHSVAAQPATGSQHVRGVALLTAYRVAAGFADIITWLLVPAGILAGLRLLIVVLLARRHARRMARAPDELPEILPPVSVVVPAYNEAVGIEAAVRSLVDTDYPDVEVIVVDDGSTDGTADIVAGLRLPRVRVLRQANGGKPAALRAGIEAAHADVLVLVDGDTVFERDTIRRLVQPLRDPAVGAVSGNTKVGNRGRMLGRWQHIEYVLGFNLDRRMYDELRCMPTVPGAIGAFRREALEAVGSLSDDTLAEDTDLTLAVGIAGYRVVYEAGARAWTEAPSTLGALWSQRYRWCYGTMQAMWKHRRSIIAGGAAGRVGRRALPYLMIFQVLLPLMAPVIDLLAIYGLLFLEPWHVFAWYLTFLLIQLVAAGYAFRLDGESLRPLWSMPLQQFVYRQLMYLVVLQSVTSALLGTRLRWHKLERTGTAAEALAR